MKNPHAKLIPIEKQPNLFRNPLSDKIYFRGTVKGKSIKFSTGVTSLLEAKKIIEDKKAAIYGGKDSDNKRKRRGVVNPLLSDLWEDFFEERSPKWSVSTQRKYQIAWKYGLLEFWGSKHIADIKSKIRASSAAVEFENWYLRHKPGRAFFNSRKAILMFLRYLENKDLIERTPKIQQLDTIINASIQRKVVGRVYEDHEIKAILEVADLRTQIGISLGRFMGLRKMEAVGSKISWIDWDKSIFTVWAKGGKWRKVPIPKFMIPILREYIKTLPPNTEWLFPMASDPTRHISSQLFDKGWTKAKTDAGIKDTGKGDARFHDLRHTFATQTVDDAWNPLVACSVLGMSLKIYQKVYAHVSDKHREKAMKSSFESRPIDT